MKQTIENLCILYHLGKLLSDPVSVTGGLMHRMYHVKTTQGEYAVKQLNANIMQRPTAFQNMVNAEMVSNALKETVPLAAAKCFDGKCILEYEGFFWIIFDWTEGKSIYPPDITETHCALVGRMLGCIHAANLQIETIKRNTEARESFAWHEWLVHARTESRECYALLQEHMNDILRWDEAFSASWPLVQRHQVISHRDLDPKNILWKGGQPVIIDWEAAGYVNPAQELVEVMNYWIVGTDGQYSRSKFDALMNAYTACIDVSGENWDAVLSASFAGMLGWLAYNTKRAVGLEGSGESDREQGLFQIRQTLRELCQYQAQLEQLKQWLLSFCI